MRYIYYEGIAPFDDLLLDVPPMLISGNVEWYMTPETENKKIIEIYNAYMDKTIRSQDAVQMGDIDEGTVKPMPWDISDGRISWEAEPNRWDILQKLEDVETKLDLILSKLNNII